MNEYTKSHGLGNAYIVLEKTGIDFKLNKDIIKRICDNNFGIGSDGILLLVPSNVADFGLEIYNPDGSEAEKSGNGLRIFSKYIFDKGYTNGKTFSIETKGGIVRSTIDECIMGKASKVTVDMGKAIFESSKIPTLYHEKETIDAIIDVGDKKYTINCVSVGNPHCVVIKDKLSTEEIMKYGPLIETHTLFPNRINVQFVKILNPTEVEILIWERGAGYTLASGSSSSAVVAVLHHKGLVGNDVNVNMPGGTLRIQVSDNDMIRMTGEVREICKGTLSEELINPLF